ncbi:hypothetical protein N7466_001177 [Penicillium verhagenii]|uniref:uncharacterized protein n=1 Tax=Penicillium verhagenii TaxID=1562060 RepID=UPI002545A2CD|nr:uncharacterized protein N7466_001177 [Penicillium verhagenii]KAJ5948162.1 hypothetical protein N7466_001177 [Penicillium verhagenii]
MANYTAVNFVDVFPPAIHQEIIRQAGLHADEDKDHTFGVMLQEFLGDPPRRQITWSEQGINTLLEANMRVLKIFTEKFPGFNQGDFYRRSPSEHFRHRGIPCSWSVSSSGGIVFQFFDVTGLRNRIADLLPRLE